MYKVLKGQRKAEEVDRKATLIRSVEKESKEYESFLSQVLTIHTN